MILCESRFCDINIIGAIAGRTSGTRKKRRLRPLGGPRAFLYAEIKRRRKKEERIVRSPAPDRGGHDQRGEGRGGLVGAQGHRRGVLWPLLPGGGDGVDGG